MKTISKLIASPDVWGSFASGLCLAHCLVTPLLFTVHIGHVKGHSSHANWWGTIDLLFLIISLLAVYWSSKKTSNRWMPFALYLNWAFLATVILNEKLGYFPIAESTIYFPSIVLIALHIYNRKYCRCTNNKCCANNS